MKVGILTFHCAHNYGAVLQCYALQEVLSGLGHEVEIIDHRPGFLTDVYSPFRLSRLKSVGEPVRLPLRIFRYAGFDRFMRRFLRLSAPAEFGIPSRYDAYVIGSDQVWNPKITRGFYAPYFADFPFEKRSKRYVAYAASMESRSLSPGDKDFLARALGNFDAVSVRERPLKALLQPLTPKEVALVLDPCLLAGRDVWKRAMSGKLARGKYVVVYLTRFDSRVLEAAKGLAQSIHAKLVRLSPEVRLGLDRYQCVSPSGFLSLMKHAECVVTTSFHGTAFSIMLGKPFYCFRLGDGWDSRSESLLETLGLAAHMVPPGSVLEVPEIDYSEANERLDALKRQSLDFLRDALK